MNLFYRSSPALKAVILFLLFASATQGQSYRCIVLSDTIYFNHKSEVWYSPVTVTQAMHIDSTGISPNGNYLFNFTRFDIPMPGFGTPSRHCFLGDSIWSTTNGEDWFMNRDGDSIRIITNAMPGTAWECYRYPNNDYLEATVATVNQATFSGITDSVKSIILQTKNANGNPVNGYYNGKEIQLSKDHGLILTYGFRDFPADTTLYEFAGTENSPGGYHNLTAAEIYDFSVGDEFHYHNYTSASIPDHWIQYIQNIVLGKTISGNGDTISYTLDQTYYNLYSSFGNQTINSGTDTIVEQIVLSEKAHLTSLTGEWFHQPFSWWTIDPTNGYNISFADTHYFSRPRKFSEDFYLYDSTSNMFVWPIGSGIFPKRIYAKGLGEVYETDDTFIQRYDSLVYYKKGTEEWGLRLNWSQILGVQEANGALSPVMVYPNPSLGRFHIYYNLKQNSEATLYLFNSLGSCVKKFPMVTGNHSVEVTGDELPSGVYYYRMLSGNSLVSSGKLTILSGQ